LLAFEAKGKGTHGIAYCAPSFHKNGCHYEIIRTAEPICLGKETANELHHLDSICKKYNLHYLENDNCDESSQIPISSLFVDDFKIYEGQNRHEALMRVMESLIRCNKRILPEEKIKELPQSASPKHNQL
jgi:hypothetical protein